MCFILRGRARWRACLPWFLFLASYRLAAAPLSFPDALALAERVAPSLVALNDQLEASQHSAVAAGRLPDPKLFAGVENLPVSGAERYSLDDDFMTMRKIGVMQEFPNARLRRAQREGAEAGVEGAADDVRIEQLRVRRETAIAWIARYTVERQLNALDQLEAETRLLAEVVRAQLAGGYGKSIDAVLPRQEAATLADRRDTLQSARTQAIGALVRWVGPEGEEALVGELPDWPIALETLAPHLSSHPELVAFEARRRLAQAAVQEAEADKHPSWDLQFAYERRGPLYSDMVTLQVSVRLPLFPATRDDPLIEARHAELRRLSAQQDDMLREHQEQLVVDAAEYQRLDRALTRQRETVLPLSAEKVALAMAAYRAGKADLTEVIAARQEQSEARLKEIALSGQRAQSAARLVYTYGDRHP